MALHIFDLKVYETPRIFKGLVGSRWLLGIYCVSMDIDWHVRCSSRLGPGEGSTLLKTKSSQHICVFSATGANESHWDWLIFLHLAILALLVLTFRKIHLPSLSHSLAMTHIEYIDSYARIHGVFCQSPCQCIKLKTTHDSLPLWRLPPPFPDLLWTISELWDLFKLYDYV